MAESHVVNKPRHLPPNRRRVNQLGNCYCFLCLLTPTPNRGQTSEPIDTAPQKVVQTLLRP